MFGKDKKTNLEDQELIQISKASKRFGIHPQTLRRWDRMGKIKAYRFGNEKNAPRMFKVSDLYELIGIPENEQRHD